MKLEKGMVIYSIPSLKKYVITRCTAKRAFIKVNEIAEDCFDIEQKDPFCFYERGHDVHVKYHYSIETDEIKRKRERFALLFEYREINTNSLSTDQLKQIIAIAKKQEESYAGK